MNSNTLGIKMLQLDCPADWNASLPDAWQFGIALRGEKMSQT